MAASDVEAEAGVEIRRREAVVMDAMKSRRVGALLSCGIVGAIL